MDYDLPEGFTLDPPPQSQGSAELPQGFTLDGPAQTAAPSNGRQTVPNPFGSPEKPMPGVMEAFGQGAAQNIRNLSQTAEAFQGKAPTEQEESPAAQPYEWSWYPHKSAASKFAYQLGTMGGPLAGGVAGGAAGTALGEATPLGPVGGTIGGMAGAALGAGAMTAAEQIGPHFAKRLKETPNDPDAAFDAAIKDAEISGAFSSASWALFPLKAFSGPIKNILFQAAGVQAPLGSAEQAYSNYREGKPLTEGTLNAYAQSGVGTIAPMAGHALISGGVNALRGRGAPAEGETQAAPAEQPQGSAELPQGFTLDNPPAETAEQYPNAPESLRELHAATGNLTPDFLTPAESPYANLPPDLRAYAEEMDRNPAVPHEEPEAETPPAPAGSVPGRRAAGPPGAVLRRNRTFPGSDREGGIPGPTRSRQTNPPRPPRRAPAASLRRRGRCASGPAAARLGLVFPAPQAPAGRTPPADR